MIIQNGGLPIGSRAIAAQIDRRRTRTNSLRCSTKMHKQSHPSIQKISVQVFHSGVRARTRAARTRWWMGLDCLSRGILLCLSPWWWACFNIRHLGHQYTLYSTLSKFPFLFVHRSILHIWSVPRPTWGWDGRRTQQGGLSCNDLSVFADVCMNVLCLWKGVRGWKCYGCNIRLYWTISIKACIKV